MVQVINHLILAQALPLPGGVNYCILIERSTLIVISSFFQYCPKWVAPNVLTFSGFLFTVVNFLMFASYDYYFYASSDDHPEYPPIPRWVFALAAFNIFMAYTLGELCEHLKKQYIYFFF